MNAPVIVFVYNRAAHARQTLEALNKNRLADQTDLFIYADNAKNETVQKQVDATRQVVDSFAAQNNFKSTTVVKAASNMGLAKSIITGVSQVIQNYHRVIVVEDDLITSADFLEYMNGALDFYEKEDIWSISAYTPKLPYLKKYSHDIYMCPRASSWGWATWEDRWSSIDWEVADYEEFMKDKAAQKEFNLGGEDLTGMLADWHEGRNNSWAIRFCYAQSRQKKLTVYPACSRVTNNGCDNSGTHSGQTNRYRTDFLLDHPGCNWELLDMNSTLIRQFRLIYDFSRIGKIKRILLGF